MNVGNLSSVLGRRMNAFEKLKSVTLAAVVLESHCWPTGALTGVLGLDLPLPD